LDMALAARLSDMLRDQNTAQKSAWLMYSAPNQLSTLPL